MNDVLSGKIQAEELQDFWESMTQVEGLHPEIEYRMKKLVHRIAPLTDKIFIKTVKAREMLVECREKTTALQNQIESDGDRTFFLLTNLEKTFEDLLRKTYDIRIKAG